MNFTGYVDFDQNIYGADTIHSNTNSTPALTDDIQTEPSELTPEETPGQESTETLYITESTETPPLDKMPSSPDTCMLYPEVNYGGIGVEHSMTVTTNSNTGDQYL